MARHRTHLGAPGHRRKEGPNLYRILGGLSCSVLVVAALWLASSTSAQDSPFGAAPSASGGSLFGAAPTTPEPAANPFAEPSTAAPQEATGTYGTTSDVDRRRVEDYMKQARQALQRGDREQALLFATSADQMARNRHVTFRAGEQSPAQF